MPYYKDTNNQLHFSESSYFEYLLPIGSVKITDEEAETLQNPPLTIDQARSIKRSEIEKSYQDDIQSDIIYLDCVFNASDTSQLLISKVISAGKLPDGFFWQDINNNRVSMTFSQMQDFACVILERGQRSFIKLQDLKNQLHDETDINKINLMEYKNDH